MRSYRWFVILFLGFLLFSCAKARTYHLYLRYQPGRDFPSLQQKIGPTLGVLPLKDERAETLYIGIHTPSQGVSSYFRSEPFPLEKAIGDSLTEVLSREGVRIVPVSSWDGRPESLKNMETESVLMIEIRAFWVEAKAAYFKTDAKASARFIIHLGVKKEGKVYTKNVAVEKEKTVFRLKPEDVERMLNEILTEIFDSFFSNPY
ncbi:MAG: hypothetical protein HXY46_15250 [Syntrophaceae bacterium]|nr:hypothetical protein [Syntrophaceae bacterium]